MDGVIHLIKVVEKEACQNCKEFFLQRSCRLDYTIIRIFFETAWDFERGSLEGAFRMGVLRLYFRSTTWSLIYVSCAVKTCIL